MAMAGARRANGVVTGTSVRGMAVSAGAASDAAGFPAVAAAAGAFAEELAPLSSGPSGIPVALRPVRQSVYREERFMKRLITVAFGVFAALAIPVLASAQDVHSTMTKKADLRVTQPLVVGTQTLP